MRTPVEYRTVSKSNYINFHKTNPSINISFSEWKNIIYLFNESLKEYILETGEKVKLPYGFGDISINKKKKQKVTVDSKGVERINLPVDWAKSKLKGKRIYNFNFHTEGYFFGWKWFKKSARFRKPELWLFKPTRSTSRLLAHYLKVDDKYQHLYREWEM